MKGATAWKMSEQEVHWVRQHSSSLYINVLGVGRGEWYRDQFNPRLLRTTACLMIVATFASGYYVVPRVGPALAQGPYMVPG